MTVQRYRATIFRRARRFSSSRSATGGGARCDPADYSCWLTYVSLRPVGLRFPSRCALLLIPAFYHIKRNTIRYTLTDSKIEIDRA